MSKKRTSKQASDSVRRVLITRAAEQSPDFTKALDAIGIESIVVPTIAIVPPESFAELDQAIAELDRDDYLILTSVNAVTAFFNRMATLGVSNDALARVRTVAVGPKSAEAITAYDVAADLIPEDYRAEGVVALLKERISGKRVLYPKAALARDLIPTELSAAGAKVIAPVAYASAPPADAAAKLKEALADELDLLTFTASSTVQNFVDLLDVDGLTQAKQIPVASIGPLTSATARKLGFDVVIEPESSTLEEMVEAIRIYFETL